MKYSVIIPIYNVENYLEECVMSIVNQNRDDVEIILVNDGSTDNSLKICNKLKENFKNIVIINKKENVGIMDSWIKGVKNSTGDYICFVDSDDKICENYFEIIDRVTKMDENDIVLFNHIKFYKNHKENIKINTLPYGKIESNKLDEIKNDICSFNSNFTYTFYRWDKVIKAEIIKKSILEISFNSTYCEDHIISALNLLNAESLYYIDENIYCYRARKSSITHKVNSNVFKDITNIENEMKKIGKNHQFNENQLYHIHLYFLFHYARFSLKSNEKHYNDKVGFKDIKNIKGMEKKIILILYKLRLKFIYKIISNIKLKKEKTKKGEYFD